MPAPSLAVGAHSIVPVFFSFSLFSFHHQRIPLVVLIGGAACVGKSTLATQLAERLNLSSVLQTDVVYALMSSIVLAGNNDAGAPRQPPSLRWQAPTGHGADVNAIYDAECALVERGTNWTTGVKGSGREGDAGAKEGEDGVKGTGREGEDGEKGTGREGRSV